MALLLVLFVVAPTALLLATGGGVRTTMADFGAFFSAVAIVFAFVIGSYGIRLRQGESVKARMYTVGIALAITSSYLHGSSAIYHGMRWMLRYPFQSVSGIADVLFLVGVIGGVIVAPVAAFVRVIEAMCITRMRRDVRSRYVDPSTLRAGALASSLAVLLIPWVALVALISLEGPRLIEPWSTAIGAKGTAGLVFSSSMPLLAPGAVLLGYAYDRALGWLGTSLRRAVAAVATAALLLAPLFWATLATSPFTFGALTPNARRDYLVDLEPAMLSPLLIGGASMVSLALISGTASLLATRRGIQPLSIIITLLLLAAVFEAVRRLVPSFGPSIVPIIAIGATIPAIVWTVGSTLLRFWKQRTAARCV